MRAVSEVFGEHSGAVFGVAYRLLGSVADAEDVASEVWITAAAQPLEPIADPRGWLVTVAARRAYDLLRSARARRETYVGPWLPEPLLTGGDAAEPVLRQEAVSTAMLVVLERLGPAERVAFVLHDVFEVPHQRIARLLGKSPAATRKLASRARRELADARPDTHPKGRSDQRPEQRPGWSAASRADRERVLAAFHAAHAEGDFEQLLALLDPDVTYVSDGGGVVPAARRPILGAEAVARLLVRLRRRHADEELRPVEVNGETGFLVLRAGVLVAVDTVEVLDGRITAYRRLRNPEKLRHLTGAGGTDAGGAPAAATAPSRIDGSRADGSRAEGARIDGSRTGPLRGEPAVTSVGSVPTP